MHQFPWRIDYSVDRRLQFFISQSFQHITHIYHQLVWKRGNGYPLTVFPQNLKSISTGAHEQRDEVNISVFCCPHRISRDFIRL